MKTPLEPNDDDALLDAILADESWQALESSVRQDSLASLRAVRRRRHLFAWARGAGAGVVLLAALVWCLHPRAPLSAPRQKAPAVSPPPEVVIGNFTDGQLLAMFPKGSCLIAEVNGRPRLIVLDEAKAARGFRFR